MIRDLFINWFVMTEKLGAKKELFCCLFQYFCYVTFLCYNRIDLSILQYVNLCNSTDYIFSRFYSYTHKVYTYKNVYDFKHKSNLKYSYWIICYLYCILFRAWTKRRTCLRRSILYHVIREDKSLENMDLDLGNIITSICRILYPYDSWYNFPYHSFITLLKEQCPRIEFRRSCWLQYPMISRKGEKCRNKMTTSLVRKYTYFGTKLERVTKGQDKVDYHRW